MAYLQLGVVFLYGVGYDIPELLKIFDLYVLPSLWEGLPMVLLEAMAAGCPIVATDVGGNNMAIQNGINGSLVPTKSVQHLADEIINLLKNKERRIEYATKSLEIFNDKFSASVMTKKYERLYLGE